MKVNHCSDTDRTYRTDSYGYEEDYDRVLEQNRINANMVERGDSLPDGRLLWRCEQCKKLQHPDHEMTRSVYYQFSGREGPYFCGYQCLMSYRYRNDGLRFAPDEPPKTRKQRQQQMSKKQWKIKNSAEKLLDTSDTKQKENILNALRAVVPSQDE